MDRTYLRVSNLTRGGLQCVHSGTPHRRRTALAKYKNYSAQLEFVKEQVQRLNDYVLELRNGRKGLAYHSCSENIVKYKIPRILCTVSFTAHI